VHVVDQLTGQGGEESGAEAVWPAFHVDFLASIKPDGILGIDFLRAFKLSVDLVAGKLVQDGTGLTLSTISLSSEPTALVIESSAVPGPVGQTGKCLAQNSFLLDKVLILPNQFLKKNFKQKIQF
jgi:hypothetical protein